jgi:hypothetical protein
MMFWIEVELATLLGFINKTGIEICTHSEVIKTNEDEDIIIKWGHFNFVYS